MKPNICVLPDFELHHSIAIAEATASSEPFDVGRPALRPVHRSFSEMPREGGSFSEGGSLFAKEGSAFNAQCPLSTLVHRVSKRVAIGISLELALAGEGLTCAEYEEQLREHPELATIQAAAKCEFLEHCIHTLLLAKNPGANIRWLLERIYPDIFGDPHTKASR